MVRFKYDLGNDSETSNLPKTRDKNELKTDNNITRAKAKIFEYAMCNEFDYFVTLTLDRKKVANRKDLDLYIKNLGQYIRNTRTKTGHNIDYLLIPEQHKDGAWHMHGLIKGIMASNLREFTLNDKLPIKMIELLKEGRKLFSWIGYSEKFGFNSLEPIKDIQRVSKYITKYITKDMLMTQIDRKNKKLYYCSRGLKEAKKEIEGTWFCTNQLPPGIKPFENDYVVICDMNKEQYLALSTKL